MAPPMPRNSRQSSAVDGSGIALIITNEDVVGLKTLFVNAHVPPELLQVPLLGLVSVALLSTTDICRSLVVSLNAWKKTVKTLLVFIPVEPPVSVKST